MNYVCTWKS